MSFNKKIKLQTLTQGNGHAGLSVDSELEVWAELSDVGVTTKYKSEAIGRQADMTATTYRKSFANHTHALVDGVRYRITAAGKAENDLHIKLILARGD